jgi:predicted DNA-binding transcriptional regulator YafY
MQLELEMPTEEDLRAAAPVAFREWVNDREAFTWFGLSRIVQARALGLSMKEAAEAGRIGVRTLYRYIQEDPTGWLGTTIDGYRGDAIMVLAARLMQLTSVGQTPELASANLRWLLERMSGGHAPAARAAQVEVEAPAATVIRFESLDHAPELPDDVQENAGGE